MSSTEENKKDSEEQLQLVSFLVGKEEYAVDIGYVQEINRMVLITRVPNAPDFVDGVINLRGRIIPVIDLRTKLGMPRKPHDKNTRIIVVEISGKTVGFIVDAVIEVIRIPASITETPPEMVTGVNSEYFKAVGKLDDRLLILIDLEKVLTTEEKTQLTSEMN